MDFEGYAMSAIALDPVSRLTKDLRVASATLSTLEARYLVDMYYQIQEMRKAAHNQVRSMGDEPHEVLTWFGTNAETLETKVRRALESYAAADPVGQWAMSLTGIGPVIAAGLMAHIDIEKAPVAGHIWSFAGLSVGQEWKKGEKCPWNAQLKTLCWKIGQSFLKFSNHKDCVYGKLLRERWEREKANNEAGLYAEQARIKLERFRIDKSTEAYKAYASGKLPPAHVLQRACRWATKLFLSHYHQVAYETRYGKPPANPWVIEHGGHVHVMPPPNWP